MSMAGKRYYGADVPRSTGPHPDPLADAIAEAVAVERERCAKIVRCICGETYHVKLGDIIENAIRT